MRFKKIVSLLSAFAVSISAVGFQLLKQTVSTAVTSTLSGDVNADGKVTISDAVMLQKWILGSDTKLTNWKNADLCSDNVINCFDLVLLKRKLLQSNPTSAYQGLVINEVCSSNSESFSAADGSSPDWVEIYNSSDAAMDISGVGLTNGNKNKPVTVCQALS